VAKHAPVTDGLVAVVVGTRSVAEQVDGILLPEYPGVVRRRSGRDGAEFTLSLL